MAVTLRRILVTSSRRTDYAQKSSCVCVPVRVQSAPAGSHNISDLTKTQLGEAREGFAQEEKVTC